MFSEDSIAKLKQSVAADAPVSGPLDVQILPTPRCNASCVFCPTNAVPDPLMSYVPRFQMYHEDLSGGLLDRLADDLYHLGGLKRVTITGGEPLLYPHLIPAVFQFVKSFPEAELTVVTNGIRLKRFAHFFVHSGLHHLSVSLNAGRPESYQLQNPGAGPETFDEIVAGASMVVAHRRQLGLTHPRVTLTAVLSWSNVDDVPALFEIGRDTGVDAVTFIPLMRLEVEGQTVNKSLLLEAEQFQRFQESIAVFGEKARAEGFHLGYAGRPGDNGVISSRGLYGRQPCYAGHAFAAIYPNGDVRACCHCEPVLGNLKEKSFSEIWRSPRYREQRDRMLHIQGHAPLPGCLCGECGYGFENAEFHRRITGE